MVPDPTFQLVIGVIRLGAPQAKRHSDRRPNQGPELHHAIWLPLSQQAINPDNLAGYPNPASQSSVYEEKSNAGILCAAADDSPRFVEAAGFPASEVKRDERRL
jgi:hypothetical protein